MPTAWQDSVLLEIDEVANLYAKGFRDSGQNIDCDVLRALFDRRNVLFAVVVD